MKLTIPHDVLAEGVAWAAHALTNRPAVPVLTGLLLEADGGELTISAFDYDTSRRVSISADVAEPGKVLLPGRVLAEVVKSLPKQPVTLTLSGAEITITCGSAEFVLLTMPADDYPTLPDVPETVGAVDGHAFAAAVAQVAPATAHDDKLPMLDCIRVDLTNQQITLAATDRYRIAATPLAWESHTFVDTGVMIPGRTLADIAKSLPAGPVSVGLTDGLAAFTGSGRTTTVRLIDEKFIDYNARLQLSDFTIWAGVDAQALAAAVKRVFLVAERHTAVRLSWTDGEVLVQAGGGDTGRGAETVAAELDGAPMEIAFQPRFLLDGLNGVVGRARIGMTTGARPALIVPADGGDTPAYRYLVMALRLS
ncbi:DNA polymerase III subunit beta [Streptosporangium sp. NPDC049078]|uniref:DNA polymerase III subunit beta n=1 Tax=Streptosporangium sp. NPDC049078 TaxID=3155767 RepID=UPI003429DF2E